MNQTKIQWTDATWNPVTGCSKVSTGCKNCYAERIMQRFAPRLGYSFNEILCHYDRLMQPVHWQKPRMIFVNSMSDLFHDELINKNMAFIARVLDVCCDARCEKHTFQILTKRPENWAIISDWIAENWPGDSPFNICCEVGGLPKNIWIGTSIENQAAADKRIPALLNIPSLCRFLSVEPILSPVEINTLEGIEWVIVGGESGPGARPMKDDWVRSIRDQCIEENVPFFFKQRSGKKEKGLPELDGKIWDQKPDA